MAHREHGTESIAWGKGRIGHTDNLLSIHLLPSISTIDVPNIKCRGRYRRLSSLELCKNRYPCILSHVTSSYEGLLAEGLFIMVMVVGVGD